MKINLKALGHILHAAYHSVDDPKNIESIRAKAVAMLNGQEIAGEDGEPLDIQTIDLTAMVAEANAEEPDEEDTKSEGEADDETKTEDEKPMTPKAVENLIAKAVAKAVAEATKAAAKNKPARKSPGFLTGHVGDANRGSGTVVKVKPHQKSRHFREDPEKAALFAHFVLAAAGGSGKSSEILRASGIRMTKAHNEGTNTAGGYLVPPEFLNEIIDLKEEYGVFRRNARVATMSSDTLSVPRRAGGLTTYWVGEGQPITESQKNWDQVQLVAKKLGVLTKYTSELSEDAMISVGDDLAQEIAYAFALKEDQTGFLGNGTSTYSGITGVISKLTGTGTAGIYTAGGSASSGRDTWPKIQLSDFGGVMGLLPQYAEQGEVKWYCSKAFYHNVMRTLALEAGGTPASEVINGRPVPIFEGYPVEMVQVMPTTTAVTQIPCLFGNLRMAAMFGDRRSMTIATSEHVGFADDELTIRGTERFDINVHDAGSSTEAGPIVALRTATT